MIPEWHDVQWSSFLRTGWHFHPWAAHTSGDNFELDTVQFKTENVFNRLMKWDLDSGDGNDRTPCSFWPRRYSSCLLLDLSPVPATEMPSKDDEEDNLRFGINDFGNECRCCNVDLPPGLGVIPAVVGIVIDVAVVGIVMPASAEKSGGEMEICCSMFRIACAVRAGVPPGACSVLSELCMFVCL